MNNGTLEEVKVFVAEFWDEPETHLGAATSVNNDLGIDGDDGVEFMLEFSQRFGVDLSTFPHGEYFGPEVSATPFSMICSIFRKVTTGSWSTFSPLMLRDLADAIEHRSWILSVPSGGSVG